MSTPRQAPSQFDWKGLAYGLLLTLIVAVPTLILEEDWHGKPMIDQGNHLWLIPATIVGAAFLGGGALIGRRKVRLADAVVQASVVGAAAIACLLIGAVVRRAGLGQNFPLAVVRLWVLASIAAVVLAAVGGALAVREPGSALSKRRDRR